MEWNRDISLIQIEIQIQKIYDKYETRAGRAVSAPKEDMSRQLMEWNRDMSSDSEASFSWQYFFAGSISNT